MLYLGIDIAKNNHVASLIDENAKPLFKAFSFSNTLDGANSLLAKLSAYANSPDCVEIGMEATGHYWLSIYSFLVSILLGKSSSILSSNIQTVFPSFPR